MGVNKDKNSDKHWLAQARLNADDEMEVIQTLIDWSNQAAETFKASTPENKKVDGFRIVLKELVRFYNEGNPGGAKFGDPLQRAQANITKQLSSMEERIITAVYEAVSNIRVVAGNAGADYAPAYEDGDGDPIDDAFFAATLAGHEDDGEGD